MAEVSGDVQLYIGKYWRTLTYWETMTDYVPPVDISKLKVWMRGKAGTGGQTLIEIDGK